MIERIKHWLTVFDLSGSIVLGIHTLVLIGISIASFVMKRPIDGSIQTVYGLVLGAFAIHRTTTATTSIITNSNQDDPPKV